MKPKHTTYLSLGSNLNDKLLYLEQAVQSIHSTLGVVKNISSVYKTPAWGFEGNDFFNICIELKTNQAPVTLLKNLLAIETSMGRERTNKEQYENRCIDIDIILYDNIVFHSAILTLPHPKATERKFVLYPLYEINKYGLFPNTEKPISEYIQTCKDESSIEKTSCKIVLN